MNRYVSPDPVGTQAYATANPLNQYPSVTPIGGSAVTLAYDLNGNVTGDGASTYAYDATNRLLSVAGAANASYGYDALDRRMLKTTGGATTRFLHAGSDEIAEYTGAGVLLRRFVPGPGADERAAMIDSGSASPPATAIKYPHTDRQGSVMAVTTSTGAVAERFSYDGYGRSSSAFSGYPFRYTGQRLDFETGLMFYKARVYSQALGRFLQTDPIGTKDDLNLYAYVGNDPINKNDPTGQWAGADDAIAIGLGATVGVGVQGAFDLWNGELSPWEEYAASAAGGAAGGEAALYTANPWAIGAANAGAASVTRQYLTTGSVDLERTLVDTAAGASLGYVGSKVLPAGAKLLPNGVKGGIGETLSYAKHSLHGVRNLVPQVRTPIPQSSRFTVVDLKGVKPDGTFAYIESKFGTSNLTQNQRLAEDRITGYVVDRWTYEWIGGVGANTTSSGW